VFSFYTLVKSFLVDFRHFIYKSNEYIHLHEVCFVLFLGYRVWYFENSLYKQIFNFKYAVFRIWTEYFQRSPDIFQRHLRQ